MKSRVPQWPLRDVCSGPGTVTEHPGRPIRPATQRLVGAGHPGCDLERSLSRVAHHLAHCLRPDKRERIRREGRANCVENGRTHSVTAESAAEFLGTSSSQQCQRCNQPRRLRTVTGCRSQRPGSSSRCTATGRLGTWCSGGHYSVGLKDRNTVPASPLRVPLAMSNKSK